LNLEKNTISIYVACAGISLEYAGQVRIAYGLIFDCIVPLELIKKVRNFHFLLQLL
jgi:hypothetical protein